MYARRVKQVHQGSQYATQRPTRVCNLCSTSSRYTIAPRGSTTNFRRVPGRYMRLGIRWFLDHSCSQLQSRNNNVKAMLPLHLGWARSEKTETAVPRGLATTPKPRLRAKSNKLLLLVLRLLMSRRIVMQSHFACLPHQSMRRRAPPRASRDKVSGACAPTCCPKLEHCLMGLQTRSLGFACLQLLNSCSA